MAGLLDSCLQMLFSSKQFLNEMASNKRGKLHKDLATILKSVNQSTSPPPSIASFSQDVARFQQKLITAKPESAQHEANGDVALYMTDLLEAIHQESNQANSNLVDPRFVPRSAMQAINYQLEYVHNSHLAHFLLAQTQSELTCDKCHPNNATWNTDWIVQLDLSSVDGGLANAPLESLGSTKTIRSSCDTCKQVCDKKQSITRAGKMVLVYLGGRGRGAHLPETANLLSMDLCSRHFELSSAVLFDKERTDGSRWFSLVRPSPDAWFKIDGPEVMPLSQEEAKQSLAKYGMLLAFEQMDQHLQVEFTPPTYPADDTVMSFPDYDDD